MDKVEQIKEIKRNYYKKYRDANKDKINEYQRQYRANNKDKVKEYNIYPKKDINPQIIEVVDNSHLERFMYECNRQDKSDAIKGV